MFLFYFLWISILPHLISLAVLKDSFSVVINAIALPLLSSTSNFYCWLAGDLLKDYAPQFYIIQCVWMLLFTFIMLGIYVAIIYAPKLWKKNKKINKSALVTGIIYIYLQMQPQIFLLFVSTMFCTDINNTSYVLSHMSYKCHTKSYNYTIYLLIIPVIVLLNVIIPGIFFFKLKKMKIKKNLGLKKSVETFGILYFQYNEKFYYWEMIKLAVRILYIFTIILFFNDLEFLAFILFLILLIYGAIFNYCKPYANNDLN